MKASSERLGIRIESAHVRVLAGRSTLRKPRAALQSLGNPRLKTFCGHGAYTGDRLFDSFASFHLKRASARGLGLAVTRESRSCHGAQTSLHF